MAPSQKVDLHVHTPASSDYLGSKEAREYISILKECKRTEVSAIAITDHNTVNGCIAFERLKKEAQTNYDLNSRRGGPKEFLEELKEELLLFESISIIHGVEISVYPKIHMVLLFDHEVKLDQITEFLKTDLGLKDAVDKGSPDAYFIQSPIPLLNLASAKFGNQVFCILPHIDSNSGALDELKGEARAELFRAPEVLAVQVVSPDTKRYLVDNILKAKDYTRKSPLQIIQASDFHGGPAGQIARQFSNLDTGSRITFAALRQHFYHQRPIKISSDFIEETYKDFVKTKAIIAFDFQNGLKTDEKKETELTQSLCATINTPNCLLEFNVLNPPTTPTDTAHQIAKLIDDRLIQQVDPPTPCSYRIRDLSHSPTRQRFVFEPLQNSRLRMLDGKVHIVVKNKVTTAGAFEVEQVVARNLYNRFGRQKQRSLSRASQRLLMISNSFPALATAYRVDQLIDRSMPEKLSKEFEAPAYSDNLEKCVTEHPNGYAHGDFYLLHHDKNLKAGRIYGHYLRYTAPTFAKKDVNSQDIKTITAPENSILLYPEGAVHLIRRAGLLYAPFPVIVITPKAGETSITLEILSGLATFLKSSFLLWYLVTMRETDDLFPFVMEDFDRLPVPNDIALLQALGGICAQVIAAEEQILKDTAKPKIEKKIHQELIEKHNEDCDKLLLSADSKIFKFLQFSEQEIREVSRTLNDLRFADYGMEANMDNFLKDTIG